MNIKTETIRRKTVEGAFSAAWISDRRKALEKLGYHVVYCGYKRTENGGTDFSRTEIVGEKPANPLDVGAIPKKIVVRGSDGTHIGEVCAINSVREVVDVVRRSDSGDVITSTQYPMDDLEYVSRDGSSAIFKLRGC